MNRSILITFIFVITSFTVNAKSTPATYILQLSSNLSCATLGIELVSQTHNTRYQIKFATGAFASTEVPSGSYKFGDVTCTNEDGEQTLDILSDKVAALNLSGGQTYYGGRMIFKETASTDINATPDVLENCTQVISRARGESSNECRDGVGVKTTPQKFHQVNVYIPDVTSKDINTLRAALSASNDELIYLPLKV